MSTMRSPKGLTWQRMEIAMGAAQHSTCGDFRAQHVAEVSCPTARQAG